MTTPKTDSPEKPLRADAQRNRDNLLATAREVFTEDGTGAPLEEVARRADVGIGTLYRHFPTRQHLLEAVYVDEVEAICAAADDLGDLEPWDALVAWLRQYVGFARTKRAIAEEMLAEHVDTDADVFKRSREAITGTGGRLLARAQEAGDVRPDVEFLDIGRLVGGISALRGVGPEDIERMLALALDGLRYKG